MRFGAKSIKSGAKCKNWQFASFLVPSTPKHSLREIVMLHSVQQLLKATRIRGVERRDAYVLSVKILRTAKINK
jgi:hypothetical protein